MYAAYNPSDCCCLYRLHVTVKAVRKWQEIIEIWLPGPGQRVENLLKGGMRELLMDRIQDTIPHQGVKDGAGFLKGAINESLKGAIDSNEPAPPGSSVSRRVPSASGEDEWPLYDQFIDDPSRPSGLFCLVKVKEGEDCPTIPPIVVNDPWDPARAKTIADLDPTPPMSGKLPTWFD